MIIAIDPLEHPAIAALLNEHHQDMNANSPPESVHALDIGALKATDVSFWCAWQLEGEEGGKQLAGCGALKDLGGGHGEIKSMRTAAGFLRRGVAADILQVIIDYAQAQGFTRLSLETGSMEVFEPARRLYQKFGFELCPPFADYALDPYSVFMTKALNRSA